MAEAKTKPTDVSVESFLNAVEDPQRRADAFTILNMMKEITRMEPRMWGPSMVGFGEYHYKYDSGHEGDCFRIGFSPRKPNFSLYIMSGVHTFAADLKKLGKHKTGKSCLYIKRLADVDVAVLRAMMEKSFAQSSQPAQKSERVTPAKKPKKKAKS